jgi:hypothetical protein
LIISRIIFTYIIANNIKAFHRESLEIDQLLESLPKEEKEEKRREGRDETFNGVFNKSFKS